MSGYELLSISVAIIAVGISVISLLRTVKLQDQQIRLNELTEKLSKKQLELISKTELANRKANIIVELIDNGPNAWFEITNCGTSMALNVNMELIDCNSNPLVKGDYDVILPIPLLQPSQTVKLMAALQFGSPSTFHARVTWTNQDGSIQINDYYLSD